MVKKEIQMAQFIWKIRRSFQRLASESNELLMADDINASHRAVLQFLDHNELETVANMARAHDVRRQHIQQIVNDLLEKKLVKTFENPSHKRSFLVKRTKAGDILFNKIKNTESTLFKEMVKEFNSEALQTAIETLTQLNDYLHSENWRLTKQKFIKKEV